ncbi:hypothetical protein AMJ82_07505 [candidate division TA06 bacterium SM23_40]|uniref:Uncharacterized protein n=1 Tax=candidate division TA06 bacterium SM23_40 TaxID=1703774 RepID=A0A0S8G7K2_UNCT6|nr:MAG: hypothetical protein AMJ82_07505 [candidate division TA06 bacterium SM23_40]
MPCSPRCHFLPLLHAWMRSSFPLSPHPLYRARLTYNRSPTAPLDPPGRPPPELRYRRKSRLLRMIASYPHKQHLLPGRSLPGPTGRRSQDPNRDPPRTHTRSRQPRRLREEYGAHRSAAGQKVSRHRLSGGRHSRRQHRRYRPPEPLTRHIPGYCTSRLCMPANP